MHVIKLGGSLSYNPVLIDCLQYIRQLKEKVVIVAGGGAFADQVRTAQQHWSFDDKAAHAMALLAMQQSAYLFKGLEATFELAHSVAQCNKYSQACIWLPDIHELNQANIKANWDITSDSLAAWLATQLNADKLTLVKAAKIPNDNLSTLQHQGIIDKEFIDFTQHAPFKIQILNHQHLCNSLL